MSKFYFFKDFFFNVDHFFKVFIESVLLLFWFFGHEARGTFVPRSGIKSTTPALEGGASTTGQPGKSLPGVTLSNVKSPLHRSIYQNSQNQTPKSELHCTGI